MIILASAYAKIAEVNAVYYFKMNGCQVKSFVDDMFMKPGTVRMRVAFVLRSAEVQPVFLDLWVLSLLQKKPTLHSSVFPWYTPPCSVPKPKQTHLYQNNIPFTLARN